jgi:hypothetical protein
MNLFFAGVARSGYCGGCSCTAFVRGRVLRDALRHGHIDAMTVNRSGFQICAARHRNMMMRSTASAKLLASCAGPAAQIDYGIEAFEDAQ